MTEGQFRELKENLDRSVAQLNDYMVVKLELKQISYERVIFFNEVITEIDDSDFPEVTGEEFVVVFPPPPPPSLLQRLRRFLSRLCL